jgi:hypothetical protein
MAVDVPSVLKERRADTKSRLQQVGGAFRSFGLVEDRHPQVTIFATGSVGRFEIGDSSDLDVFIIDAARGGEDHLTNLGKYELVADLIRAGQGASFPSFSRDGEFLHVHRLEDLVEYLGKPDEDKLNVFTARMLLVLESQCLMGLSAYGRAVDRVLDRYWAEDTEEHDFKPFFLINDIVRYWKTLCLAYEGWRKDLGGGLKPEDRIDLLKLKFNRLWLCFSGLAFLLLGDGPKFFPRVHGRRLVELKPVQRMVEVAESVPAIEARVAEALDHYGWWLDKAGAPKDELHTWIADDSHYMAATECATAFGDSMAALINDLGDRAGLTRYLLV